MVKELGTMARNFGRRGARAYVNGLARERRRAAVERPKRLFTKNTGLCRSRKATYRV